MIQVFLRRVGESPFIGDAIEVTVLSIRDDEVRLEVATPKSVSVQAKKTHGRNHSGRIA